MENTNVLVEVPMKDGCTSMYCGKVVREEAKHIVLREAAWVACTGRRHLFMKGQFDSKVEVEPYLDDQEISLPSKGAIVTTWPHALLREAQ